MYEKTKCELAEKSKDLRRTEKSNGLNHNSVGTTTAYHTGSKESLNVDKIIPSEFLWNCSLIKSFTARGAPDTGFFPNFRMYGTIFLKEKNPVKPKFHLQRLK
mgnify:FL=1